ncbi:MAG TPA: CBS domain-containing protein [Pyrinomonadaceae bacterium]|nr:CBS domain-containing protein [Pyrinomonadaceae bacterium]
MKCQDVMTDNPVCCLPDDTVGQAARLMRREHLGSIPVISDDRSRSLIGIISDSDLATKVVAESRDPNHTQIFDVMTRTVVACRGTDDVTSAIKAMREHQIRRVPVVDYDGHVIGVISQGDVSLRVQPREASGPTANMSQAA